MSKTEKIVVCKEDYKKMSSSDIVSLLRKHKTYRITSENDFSDRYIIEKK